MMIGECCGDIVSMFGEKFGKSLTAFCHSMLALYGRGIACVGGMDLLNYRLYPYTLHVDSGQWTVDMWMWM